jgi:hypothetical protein
VKPKERLELLVLFSLRTEILSSSLLGRLLRRPFRHAITINL